MKTLPLALVVLAFSACGNDNNLVIEDMTVLPDLAMSIDMAMLVPDGVQCGNVKCSTSMVCCIRPGAGMTVMQTCMAPGTCGDGAAQAMCDGPEDCSSAQPNCCVNISFAAGPDGGTPNPTGGSAKCITDCPAQADLSGSAQTKLCKVESDCLDYEGFVPFDGCCSSNMLPGVKFCAPKTFAGRFGYTCN